MNCDAYSTTKGFDHIETVGRTFKLEVVGSGRPTPGVRSLGERKSET